MLPPLIRRYTHIYPIISRYLLVELFKWFALSFSFFFAVFFVNNILLLAKDILARQVPLHLMARLLAHTFPTILTYTLPFSMLLSTIISMIQHSIKYEIIAMQASGISLFRCYIPIACVGAILSAITFFVADYLLPQSAINFVKLYQEILFTSPGLELEPYSVRRYQNNLIISGAIEGNEISQPLIIEPDINESQRRIIVAKRAQLLLEQERGILTLHMDNVDGHTHEISDLSQFDYFQANTLEYNVLLYDLNIGLRSPTAREMQLRDVRRYLQDNRDAVEQEEQISQYALNQAELELRQTYYRFVDDIIDDSNSGSLSTALRNRLDRVEEAVDNYHFDQSYRVYETEYIRRFALPTSCLVFTMFGFPVGIRLRKANWSIGFGIGLAAAVIFWCLLIGGQAITIQQRTFNPFLIIWLPNMLIATAGVAIHIIARIKR